MKFFDYLKKENRGVSLIAVVVAIFFVSTIGVIVTQTTITNIRMKEIEKATKVNFYSSEQVTDELGAKLNDVASTAMKDAYVATLSNYRNVMAYGNNIQKDFSDRYLNQLKTSLSCVVEYKDAPSDTTYETGYTDFANVKNLMTNADGSDSPMKQFLVTPTSNKVFYEVDYTNSLMVLKDLTISYTDTKGYKSVIHTDIVLHTPKLNFSGTNIVKEFMRYSVIADNQLKVSSQNVNIGGNAYAGEGGIVCTGSGAANFSGNTVVTRGTIQVQNGGDLTVGGTNSKVWAENIENTGSGSASKLVLNGNIYVSDDLSLNGTSTVSGSPCIVEVNGNYYGYNFQDMYRDSDAGKENKDASYSSAIVINGKNNKLNLENATYLLLSGRTYISRTGGTGNNDVALGESISVRSNQMAYFVPTSYVDITGTKPFISDTFQLAQYYGVAESAITANVKKNATGSEYYVATYNYVTAGGASDVVYYLDFASEQCANNFYAAYAAANSGKINTYANKYLTNDALILSPTLLYSLKGDILSRASAGADFTTSNVTIGGSWNKDSIYWNFAKRMGITYKSLQMYLESYNNSITVEDIRFWDATGNNIDKSLNNLFDNLIDRDSSDSNGINLDADLAALPAGTESIIDDSDVNKVIVITKSSNYTVPGSYKGGIIIATGNVQLNNNFNGMIISAGDISFATNVTTTADEMMVSQMFTADMALDTPLFSKYFKNSNTFSESVIGDVRVDDFLTYDNWSKTED